MSEENKNEVIEDGEEITEEGPGTAYSMVSFFSFVLLIASLVAIVDVCSQELWSYL